ncbi:hypothetical protein [Fluviicoccus keumensis]|uniref:hypothetical protein n=1 Tax=Fluviicoccus keumensis TaxID=1435465 RepID=UPI00102BB2E7|nr:hypothetical protein [Fluviicoccus keumensis]
METSYLLGKTIQNIFTYPLKKPGPAWQNELTTSLCTDMVFLELSDGVLVGVEPCEVSIDGERYPALGLALELCERNATRLPQSDGQVIDIVSLNEAAPILPLKVIGISESDPMGEGAISQIRIEGVALSGITIRHIMPPITLGIIVESAPVGWVEARNPSY